ncbi:Cdc6/Cdc18 family protein [Halobium salinum]|uniref:Cdc6/Cdc18 family protein n=1 Tax=Halobium salinum TaxID=1364940 RepID=A0ABD5P7C9_9EURY|nr:AAA family ATPase [Halobium salinum]
MDIDERISRRLRTDTEPQLVVDYEALSPVSHPAEPTGRGPALERVLDHLDPAFDDRLPSNAYVYGPKGSGKSAILSALFSRLVGLGARSRRTIPTTTRSAPPPSGVEFAYVDARRAKSDFALSHALLDALVDERVPEQGLGVEHLRERLRERLGDDRRVVVAVDHLGEPETRSVADVAAMFEPLSASCSWVGVGRAEPSAVDAAPTATVELPPYRPHGLTDVLTARTSRGLARHGISHERIRRVAEWADGDAHDALAAVFGAADRAATAGREAVDDTDVETGIDAVPRPCVSLGRVFALPANRRQVLATLVELSDEQRRSVRDAAGAIAAAEGVDLSEATVTRILYELAEVGVAERVTQERTGQGRPPSRLEPRFPTAVFRRLFALGVE